jgi:hypothetical protein
MLPEVWYATWTSWPWSQRRMKVPPIEMTSSSGCGLKTSTRLGKMSGSRACIVDALAGDELGAAGLAAGPAGDGGCRARKTSMLMS